MRWKRRRRLRQQKKQMLSQDGRRVSPERAYQNALLTKGAPRAQKDRT